MLWVCPSCRRQVKIRDVPFSKGVRLREASVIEVPSLGCSATTIMVPFRMYLRQRFISMSFVPGTNEESFDSTDFVDN